MKSIRWPGFVAFVVLVALLIGGALLFAGPITKSILESTLSKMNGARVDIASVDISWSPLAMQLNDIQVTDKQQPMINAVQIGNARFQISFGDVLLKKVIIDEMSMNRIEVDTPRKVSGALKKQQKPEMEDKDDAFLGFDMPDMELPDIKEILQIEPLQTDKLIETLNNDFDTTRQQWQASYDDITNQARWDTYQVRYDQIREAFKGNFAQKLAAIKDAKALRDDLKKEIEKVRQIKQQFSADSDRLEAEYKAAKDGPKNDVRAIKEKYKIENLNASNITQMLFGEQAAHYVTLAQTWYQRIKPYLGDEEPEPVKRSEGVNVAFREFNPKPGFLVANAALNVITARGEFEGKITDISSDQSINKKPTRFLLSGKDMRHRDSEQINGEINYIKKDQGFVEVNYTLQAYQLNDFAVTRSSKLAVNMASGIMDMKLQTRMQSGQLRGNANMDFNRVQFKTDSTESGHALSQMLSASLGNVNRFNINASFSGSFKDLDLKIRSDLDNQLGAQLKAQFKQRVDQFEQELRARIEAKYQEPLQKIDARMQQLRDLKARVDQKEAELKQQLDDLESRINQEKSLKEQELKSRVDENKDKLLDKLKNKLLK